MQPDQLLLWRHFALHYAAEYRVLLFRFVLQPAEYLKQQGLTGTKAVIDHGKVDAGLLCNGTGGHLGGIAARRHQPSGCLQQRFPCSFNIPLIQFPPSLLNAFNRL